MCTCRSLSNVSICIGVKLHSRVSTLIRRYVLRWISGKKGAQCDAEIPSKNIEQLFLFLLLLGLWELVQGFLLSSNVILNATPSWILCLESQCCESINCFSICLHRSASHKFAIGAVEKCFSLMDDKVNKQYGNHLTELRSYASAISFSQSTLYVTYFSSLFNR